MPATEAAVVDEAPPAEPSTGVAVAATLGRSPLRRFSGMVSQYGLLVVLAAVVLAPLVYTLILALSPPAPYIRAGAPLHPVSVDWKDRTWFSGGVLSVVLRTAAVVAALAWVQILAARRLPRPRQVVATLAGAAAVIGFSTPIFQALFERASTTTLWFVVAISAVALTQAIGIAGQRRSATRVVLHSAALGLAVVGATVLLFGADAWNQAWGSGQLSLAPAMVRSFAVATLITVCQVVTSILAGYAFAYLRFPLKGLVFAVFMGTLLLPLEVTLLANVQTIRQLGWIDSNQALVLPFAATAFGTFLVRQGFKGIPPEIRDATRLDGYGHLAFLWRFAVPLTRPVIASFTVIAAMGAWNQYLWPRAVIDSNEGQTTQIKLRTILGNNPDAFNVNVAAAFIVAIPVVLMLIAFSRQIIRGLTAGAVKG